MRKFSIQIVSLWAVSTAVTAGSLFGTWNEIPIFSQEPLEVRLGTFGNGAGPDALAVVLWNDGAANQLTAITIPPPYDGTGVSSTLLDSSGTLFALGDICTGGSDVVVPYIKDFNIEVARHNGSSWSTSTVPGTTTNSFTSADCAVSGNNFFVSGQDFNDSEVEFFKTTNGGGSYSFYGRYFDVLGPFSGAVRDQTAILGSDAYSFNQASNGQIRATHFNPLSATPSFTHTDIINLPAPSGSFTFVKESAVRMTTDGYMFLSYNADGNARIAKVPLDNPGSFTTGNLGTINNTGSRFGFQGGGLVHIEGEQNDNVIWGDYFLIQEGGAFSADNNFPAAGIGGPVDGCLVTENNSRSSAWVAPRSTGAGTDLLFRDEPIPSAIFTDGFESGDTSKWSSCQ